MPKITYISAEKEKADIRADRRKISDGLAVTKNRKHLTNLQIAKELCVSQKAVQHIFSGEKAVLDFDTILKLIRFSGYRLERTIKE